MSKFFVFCFVAKKFEVLFFIFIYFNKLEKFNRLFKNNFFDVF